MTEISQLSQVNGRYVAPNLTSTQPQVPASKSALLSQPIKDEVSFGSSQAPAKEEKGGGALKWILGLGVLVAGALFLRKHFKGKDAQKLAGEAKDAVTDAAQSATKPVQAATTEAAQTAVKTEQAVVTDAVKPATTEVKAHDFTIKYAKEELDSTKAVSSEVKAHDFTIDYATEEFKKPSATPLEHNSVTGYQWQTKTTSPVTVELVKDKPSLLTRFKALFTSKSKPEVSKNSTSVKDMASPKGIVTQERSKLLVRGKNSLSDELSYPASTNKGVPWSPWGKNK